MKLCSDEHEEVCYEGEDCPVCKAIKEWESASDETHGVLDEVNELQREIEDLKDEILDLKVGV